ncbi:MAG: (2Fe-2S)-binding protein [Anaerolineales bacterium]
MKPAPARYAIRLRLNGRQVELEVEARRTLLELLREDLGLTGTKSNCQAGECGACTVVLDGRAVNSCILLAVRADGAELLTVEGLAKAEQLHPIQEAFVRNAAIQCGYCTPGFVMSLAALLQDGQQAAEIELREAVVGNICRCTGYTGIAQALRDLSAGQIGIR